MTGPSSPVPAQAPPSHVRSPRRTVRSHRLSGEHFVLAARVSDDPSAPSLMMAIPRKLVPSSPVRNLMRRVIREAWRLRSPGAARVAPLEAWSVRVQLVKIPVDPAAPLRTESGKTLRPFARRPTDGKLKRQVRTEVDALISRFLARTAVSDSAPSP